MVTVFITNNDESPKTEDAYSIFSDIIIELIMTKKMSESSDNPEDRDQ